MACGAAYKAAAKGCESEELYRKNIGRDEDAMEPKDNIIRPSFHRQFDTHVSGDNTVRKAVPYLDRYQQEQLERQQERQRRWEKQIHKRAVQKEFEERRRRANALTFAEAAVVGVLCAVLLFACIFYVGQQAKLNQSRNELASLQKTYAALVEDNNARSSALEGSIDYQRIYEYATQELGMMYPEKGQTVTYKRNPGSYVKQAEEIPSN